ncbi:MAG: hypothetical protein ACK4GL_09780 [Flavobacteriales bacterium]
MKIIASIGLILLIVITSCKKEEYINPYSLSNNNNGNGNNGEPTIDPNSIAGIHQRILKPTCANSGCHDGTFEPDFRTVESSYNTLVYHPVIKNNPQGIYTYRVIPGNVQLSQFYKRLIEDIDGQSGIMPLSIEPDSDWEAKNQEYISNIYNWIQNGARDIFGNTPQQAAAPIQLTGMVATLPGSNQALSRSTQNSAIQIPTGVSSIDLWFAIVSGNSSASDLAFNQAYFSSDINNFPQSAGQSLQIASTQNWPGFSGNPMPYSFKITVNVNQLPSNLSYVRLQIKVNENDATIEMPNNGSAAHVKQYYSLERN